MLSMTWKDVWHRRLARHYLLKPAPAGEVVKVVDAVCGIQAQVMPAAELCIGIRVAGVTRQDVRDLLWEQRLLVKTYGLRGTVHLFPASDLSMWMAAVRARPFDEKRLEVHALDRRKLQTLVDAIGSALDGQRLTMKELGEEVVRRLGAWAGEKTGDAWSSGFPRWRMAIAEAAEQGQLCYGPPDGNEVTFVRPDQWTGVWKDVEPQEALREVFRRYLRAYGPATTRDFAQWFAVPPRVGREVGEELRDEMEEVDVEGYRAYVLAGDTEVLDAREKMPVRLLPHFDCYVIGCHPRDRLLPPEWNERVPPRTTPSQLQVLLVDGVVAGLWERKAKGARVDIKVESWVELNKRQKGQLEEEAVRVGEILEGEGALEMGKVDVRPHL
jgi:hypothetical protein